MDMDREVIFQWAPEYWNKLDDQQTDLAENSEEYRQMAFEVRQVLRNHSKPIEKIVRVQNVYDLSQCLVRGQLLTTASSTPLYRVRRFIKINKQYLTNALQWNLDHRRCGLSDTVFRDTIPAIQFSKEDVLLIVQVLTNDPNASEIRPKTTLEYFIDYIVYF